MKVTKDRYGDTIDGDKGISDVDFYKLEDKEEEMKEIAEILFKEGFTSEDRGVKDIKYMDIDIKVDLEKYSDILKEIEEIDEEAEKKVEKEFKEYMTEYKLLLNLKEDKNTDPTKISNTEHQLKKKEKIYEDAKNKALTEVESRRKKDNRKTSDTKKNPQP